MVEPYGPAKISKANIAKAIAHAAVSVAMSMSYRGCACAQQLQFKPARLDLGDNSYAFPGCQPLYSSILAVSLWSAVMEEALEHFGKSPIQENPSTVIDGVLLPKTPEEILAEKSFNTVPYMVGINKKVFGWMAPMASLSLVSSWDWLSVLEVVLKPALKDMMKPDQSSECKLGQMIVDLFSEENMDEKMASSLVWKFHSVLVRLLGIMGIGWETKNIPENMIPAVTEKYLGQTDDLVKKKDLLLDLFGDVFVGIPSVLMSRGLRVALDFALGLWDI
ncbi:liver carboxylesterase 1-like protein [Cricetulus griseus]|uniref:Liver carboxylesterase 1-like protein n=1 Tax=Cricetulus griseus TaxID=10029 RepID=A0A061IAH7_CRIGR|nr:liver carboxylesterase 1-like protein [Cricetulus griseus]